MFLTRNQYPTFLLDTSLLSLLKSSSAPDTSLLLSPRPVSGLLGARQGNLWRLRGLTASEPPSSGEDRGVQSPVRMTGWQGGMTAVELQHDTCHSHTSVTTDQRKHRVCRYNLAASCWSSSHPEISFQCQLFIETFTTYLSPMQNWKILTEFAFFLLRIFLVISETFLYLPRAQGTLWDKQRSHPWGAWWRTWKLPE